MSALAASALARRAPVWGVLALAFVLLGWGELRASDPYTSAAFVVRYFWTELQVTALLVVATAWFWSARSLGLRWRPFAIGGAGRGAGRPPCWPLPACTCSTSSAALRPGRRPFSSATPF